ncbi:MAG: lipopolysaccharide heptosyltransferase II [Cyanobacteria bacterium]|nr:lipopolysaccharide heptosyltransferase II [Cyanobacteriota bacterium]
MSERIVVIAPNWLGDAVMALPAFADLRRHFSSAHIAVAARPPVAPMYAMVSGVDQVITLPGGGGWRAWTGWREDVRALEAGSFETAILLPNSYGAARNASKAGIRERWGYATDGRGRLLTRAIDPPHGDLHQRAYYQALTKALGIQEGPPFASVRPDRAKARDVLREIGLDIDEPFVVFAPGAAYGRAKQWLPERYAELADLIINERGWSVMMVGAGVDRSTCDDIARRLPKGGTRINRLIDFSGKSDLPTLAGILGEARAVVSNDSGAMHLAGAVGTKVIAVFGPTRERQTSPLPSGPDAPAPVVITHDVFCRPCMLRECPIDHRCMRRISARQVFDAI